MTGAQLRALVHGYALGSPERLAKRIGCHRSTITRGTHRETVTGYVAGLIDNNETASAFLRGMMRREP